MEFKDRIKELRIEKNLSISNLAEIANVSKVSAWQWENGMCFPKEKTLEKIADYFNVSLDYLMGRTEERNSHDSAEDQTSISARYKRLTETQKLIVSNLVDEFLKKSV